MSKEEIIKALKVSCLVGILTLGFYNVLILLRYFKNGRDRSIISGDPKLYLTDLAVFVATFIVIMAVELISCKLRKNKRSDSSSGSEE